MLSNNKTTKDHRHPTAPDTFKRKKKPHMTTMEHVEVLLIRSRKQGKCPDSSVECAIGEGLATSSSQWWKRNLAE
jgi:hypothetical protein